MQIDHALHFFAGAQQQFEQLLADVPDERWAEQPAGIRNHPAWTVGHLCVGHNLVLSMLGGEGAAPAEWAETMDYGTMPVGDRAAYPDGSTLLDAYRQGHDALVAAVESTTAGALAAEMPIEAYRSFFPTIGHVVSYFLLTHEPTHFGQVVAWKRAAGLMPA